MPLFALSLIIQVFLVIHIMKTGRDTIWIWVVILLPGAGSLAYAVAELLPELLGSRTARQASRSVEQIINPNKGINSAAQDYSISNTVENSLKLAEECTAKGMHEEAAELYEKSLTGIHEHDPTIMVNLAEAQFRLGNFPKTKQTLEHLIEKNPEYKNQDAHLLYAKTVEELGETSKALEEYKVLADYYSGAEAKYRYASLLRRKGQAQQADSLLIEIAQSAKLFGKHYSSMNREWITLAKKELGSSTNT